MDESTPQTVKRLLIVGAGRMGVEIASKSAAAGLDVKVFDQDAKALDHVEQHISTWRLDERGETEVERLASAARNLRLSPTIESAAEGVDLVIEAVNEDLTLKREVLAAVANTAPDSALIATNTSSLVPSQMAYASGRPDRFAAMHFLYSETLVEIMGHHQTAPSTLATLRQFCLSIGHTPVDCLREIPGYISNSLLFPVAQAAMQLLAVKAASFEDIDRCFMVSYKSSHGPFGYLDFVGLDTALDVLQTQLRQRPDRGLASLVDLIQPLVDQGRVGARVGRGFYDYPNPAYSRSDFLSTEGVTIRHRHQDEEPAAPSNSSAINLSEWKPFDGIERRADGSRIARFQLKPSEIRFLADHCYRSKPVLPIAAVIALVKAVVETAWPGRECGVLTDVRIANGMRFFVDRTETLTIEVSSGGGGGAIECTLSYPFRNRVGALVDAERPVASAKAWLQSPSLEGPTPRSKFSHTHRVAYSNDASSLRYGPSMRLLKAIEWIDETNARGEIARRQQNAEESEGSETERSLHKAVALIDAVLLTCNAAINSTGNTRVLIPQEVSKVQLASFDTLADGTECFSRTVDDPGGGIVADCDVVDPKGGQVIAIEGYRAVDVSFEDLPYLLEPIDLPNEDAWRCFAECRSDASSQIVSFDLDPSFGFITDHRFRGKPLLPLAGILQLMRYAVEQFNEAAAAWDVRDVSVENGLKFFGPNPERVWVQVIRRDSDYLCELRHDFKNRRGDVVESSRLIASAVLSVLPSNETVEVASEFDGNRFEVTQHDDPSRLFYIGQTMRALTDVCFSPERGSGKIDAGRTDRALHDAERGVAVIDAGLCACNAHTQRRFECGLQIPQRVSHVILGRHANPDESCRVEFHVTSADETRTRTDLVITGENGDRIAEFCGYECAVMKSPDGPLTILTELAPTVV